MKKLIAIVMMLLAVVMVGCSGDSESKTDIGILGLSMGEPAHDVKEKLHNANVEFDTENFGKEISSETPFEWLGIEWGVLNCRIGDEGLEFVELWSSGSIDPLLEAKLYGLLIEKGFSCSGKDERFDNAVAFSLNDKYKLLIAENPNWTSVTIYPIDKEK